jgi:trans-aconitate 2-methyltransferase
VTWNPDQYQRFADERSQPFHDLLDLLDPQPTTRAVDLGCGSGELTAIAAERFAVDHMVGIDNSASMLERATTHQRPGLTFVNGDIGEWTSNADHDLVLANASLQWVPDHRAVLARWVGALDDGGQLAVQVPTNAHMPTHVVAAELAHEEPFASAFGPEGPPPDPVRQHVLEPEVYAQLLYDLGIERPMVRLVVYPHVLADAHAAVEWVKGTTLTRFSSLPDHLHQHFVDEYRRRLVDRLGDARPLFFPFRRILMVARR